jgi:hypothetical protein
MSTSLQWITITAACLGVFVGLRLMPVESCEFLHYGDYVDENGVIEGCGYEETSFFDTSELRFPIIVDLIPDQKPVVGRPVGFTLALRTTTGRPIDAQDIAITHTEKLHAMIVDESLADYQHIHPTAEGPSGHFRFTMTPREAGKYRVYLDFIPLINNRRTLLAAGFEVAAAPATVGRSPSPTKPEPILGRAGGHQFELKLDKAKLSAGEPFQMELVRHAKDGRSVPFELVMGAYAHLVAFDPRRRGFAHLHPMNPIAQGQNPLNPDMRFELELDQPGDYRLWAQVRIDGEDLFIPFDLSLQS